MFTNTFSSYLQAVVAQNQSLARHRKERGNEKRGRKGGQTINNSVASPDSAVVIKLAWHLHPWAILAKSLEKHTP